MKLHFEFTSQFVEDQIKLIEHKYKSNEVVIRFGDISSVKKAALMFENYKLHEQLQDWKQQVNQNKKDFLAAALTNEQLGNNKIAITLTSKV